MPIKIPNQLPATSVLTSENIFVIRGVVSRGVTAAAGQQSHDHGQGQQERKYFFHIEDYSFSYVCCSRDGLSINSRK